MSAATLVASVGAYTALGLLVWAGLSHSLNIQVFRESLQSQRSWSSRALIILPIGVCSMELAIGLGGLAGIVVGIDSLATAALLSAITLYAFYGAYAYHLTRLGKQVRCGCGKAEISINKWVWIRAVALSLCALGALMGEAAPSTLITPEEVIVTTSAAAFAVLVWNLPAAVNDSFEMSATSLK